MTDRDHDYDHDHTAALLYFDSEAGVTPLRVPCSPATRLRALIMRHDGYHPTWRHWSPGRVRLHIEIPHAEGVARHSIIATTGEAELALAARTLVNRAWAPLCRTKPPANREDHPRWRCHGRPGGRLGARPARRPARPPVQAPG